MTVWTTPGFVIPGQFLDPQSPYRGTRWASYMCEDLFARILAIAGEGHPMYWHEEWEIVRNFRVSTYFNWGWVPVGNIGADQNLAQQKNVLDSMRLCFRCPEKAMLVRLSI